MTWKEKSNLKEQTQQGEKDFEQHGLLHHFYIQDGTFKLPKGLAI